MSLDQIANTAVQDDPDTSFSYMGETYDNVHDYHDAIFGDDDDPVVTTTQTAFEPSTASAGRDLDADLGVGMTNNTVTADELESGFNNPTLILLVRISQKQ